MRRCKLVRTASREHHARRRNDAGRGFVDFGDFQFRCQSKHGHRSDRSGRLLRIDPGVARWLLELRRLRIGHGGLVRRQYHGDVHHGTRAAGEPDLDDAPQRQHTAGRLLSDRGGWHGKLGNIPAAPDARCCRNDCDGQHDGKGCSGQQRHRVDGQLPNGGAVVDFVGYGASSCFEGMNSSTAPDNATAVARARSGCADVNDNSSDFSIGPPNPRNSASVVVHCGCTIENESGAALEVDYCDTQSPLALTIATGATTPPVFGRIFETGVSGTGSPNANVRAQLGYGPRSANPEYQPGWTWSNATYNAACSGCGDEDEYQSLFLAPVSGAYGYVYRFSLDQGVSWTYCDNDQNDFGAGSNVGLAFSFGDEAMLTVVP